MAGLVRSRERVGMNNKIINHSLKRMMSGFCSTALIACFVLGGSTAFARRATRLLIWEFFLARKKVFPPRSTARGSSPELQSRRLQVRPAFRYNPNSPAPMEDIGQSFRGLISRGFGINNIGVVVGDEAFIAASTADSPSGTPLFSVTDR